ncbi:MAG: zinc ribbon domain-containing protein, partial [Phycisphaerae bacterium]
MCQAEAPDDNFYCGKCGAALKPKDLPVPPATMTVDNYAKFLSDMDQKHFDFLQRTMYIGAAIFMVYAAAIGVGTFYGVEARLDSLLTDRLADTKLT